MVVCLDSSTVSTQVYNLRGYRTCTGTKSATCTNSLPGYASVRPGGVGTHPWLCLDVLPQKPLLIEGVPGFPCDGIDGTFVNLLFDGTDQEEEGLSDGLLGEEDEVSKWDLVAVAPSSGVAGTGSAWTLTMPPHIGEQDWSTPGAVNPRRLLSAVAHPIPTSISLRLLGSFQTCGNVTAQTGKRT